MAHKDLIIGGRKLKSRLFTGTGKYSDNSMMPHVLDACGTEVVTMAVRRVDLNNPKESILTHIPPYIQLLPNTSGARNAEEAIRIARLARAMGCGDWIKIEVIHDMKYLMPDNAETVKATEVLAKEGFVVLPYMCPDPMVARQLEEVGAATIMPLGSPIGSNRGIRTTELIEMIIESASIPVVIDAGLGKPSDAAMAMELGADAVLVNTAIATSPDPIAMGRAFKLAVNAGRTAYEAGLGRVMACGEASSPLTGFLREEVR